MSFRDDRLDTAMERNAHAAPRPFGRRTLGASVCFRLARRRMRSQHSGDAGCRPETFRAEDYVRRRDDELRAHFEASFGREAVAGRDVLDLGCGTGGLSLLAARLGARSVVGLDVEPEPVRVARERARDLGGPVRPTFAIPPDPRKLPLPAESMDAILLFDVLEHLMDPESVLSECGRVLRRGGRMLVWWVPWRNPWGHHVESLVPIPWTHLLFRERDLVDACARIYDLPGFEPRAWDLDAGGRKAPNKWLRLDRLPDLNRLTVRRFEEMLGRLGLRVLRKEVHGFQGSRLARATAFLARIPGIGEAFTSFIVYEIGHAERAGTDTVAERP